MTVSVSNAGAARGTGGTQRVIINCGCIPTHAMKRQFDDVSHAIKGIALIVDHDATDKFVELVIEVETAPAAERVANAFIEMVNRRFASMTDDQMCMMLIDTSDDGLAVFADTRSIHTFGE